jgi:glycogen debranching enzyme
MVLFARQLGIIDSLTGKSDWRQWQSEADEIAGRINRLMWNPDRRFYFDLTVDGRRIYVKTIAAFWTLLAGVAGPEQAAALAAELRNPATFGRIYPVPSCAADEPGYVAWGGYWRGAVWPSTNTMVISTMHEIEAGFLTQG